MLLMIFYERQANVWIDVNISPSMHTDIRSLEPAWSSKPARPVYVWMQCQGPPILHWKGCSTYRDRYTYFDLSITLHLESQYALAAKDCDFVHLWLGYFVRLLLNLLQTLRPILTMP
jgi:hypothetical protein